MAGDPFPTTTFPGAAERNENVNSWAGQRITAFGTTGAAVSADDSRLAAEDDSVNSLGTRASRQASRAAAGISFIPILTRALMVLTVLLLGSLTVLISLVAYQMNHLVGEVRHQELVTVTDQPLPSAEVLRDDDQFATVLAAQPERRRELLAGRASAFAAVGDHRRATALYHRLRFREDAPLSAEETVAYAGSLIHLRRFATAEDLLQPVATAEHGDEAVRKQAIDLLVRLHLHDRQ